MNVRPVALVLVLAAIAGAIFYFESLRPERAPSPASADIPLPETASIASGTLPSAPTGSPKPMPPPRTVKNYPRAKEIVAPAGYINTPRASPSTPSSGPRGSGQASPIALGELVGKKVILVDFWTFSCINCQRTTPYLNAWYGKYKDKGLEIVGIHTPEFPFEAVYENVKAAVEKAHITYPVVLDNDYGTWQAYGNRFWPRKYLIDIDGYIVYDHIGEGAYEDTEKKIQELLLERMARLNLAGEIAKDTARPAGVTQTDFSQPRSPETYFGAARNQFLGNGEAGKTGPQRFTEPSDIKADVLYLAGGWNFSEEYAENSEAGARIVFKYQGKDVYLVAGALSNVKVRVLRDGKPLGAEAGADVKRESGETYLTIQDETLYRVVEDDVYEEHTIELEILSPGLRAYTFTFG